MILKWLFLIVPGSLVVASKVNLFLVEGENDQIQALRSEQILPEQPQLKPISSQDSSFVFQPRQKLWMRFNESFGLFLHFQEASAFRSDLGLYMINQGDFKMWQKPTSCYHEGLVSLTSRSFSSHSSFFVMDSCSGPLQGSIVLRRQGSATDDNFLTLKLSPSDSNEYEVSEGDGVVVKDIAEAGCVLKKSGNATSHSFDPLGMMFERREASPTRVMEIFVINDYYRFREFGDGTELNAIQLIQYSNMLFAQEPSFPKLKIVFMMTETKPTFLTGSETTVDVSDIIDETCAWRKRLFDSKNTFGMVDAQIYLTSRSLVVAGSEDGYSIQGVAYLGGTCTADSACAVVHADINSNTARQAIFLSHEVGHLLGSEHDGKAGSNSCPDQGYVMQAVGCSFCKDSSIKWSSCSVKSIDTFLASANSQCVSEKLLVQAQLCGNGILDEGEECDSTANLYRNRQGFSGPVETACCTADCKLKADAQCDENTLGERSCCSSCKFKTAGTICNTVKKDSLYGPCDLEDTCSGDSATCTDLVASDETACWSNNEKGICIGAQCRTRSYMCQSFGALYSYSSCDASQSCTLNCQKGSSCVTALEGLGKSPVLAPNKIECLTAKAKKGYCNDGICISSQPVSHSSSTLLLILSLFAFLFITSD